MKMKFSDLWRSSGTIDRGPYAVIGLIGFAVKHNLDRLIASLVFHRPWSLFNYLEPMQDVLRITALSRPDAIFLESMVLFSLPFIWVGVALTMKRLRSANLPLHLVVFFFVPFVNLLFFLLLCLLPSREEHEEHSQPLSKDSSLARMIPESALGSAAIALLITVPLGLGMMLLGVRVLANYGWGIFVALPFTMGFGAALIYGLRRPRSLSGCIQVASLSIAILGASLFALAVEGVACLAMTIPLALPLGIIGGVFGYLMQRQRWLRQATPAFLGSLLLLTPGVQCAEHIVAPPPRVYEVRTSIDIQAPPEKVWEQVVAFSEIPPPQELVFRAGVAYPIRARIFGKGVGAERHCEFSTGAFVEPIQVWDEPRLLKFSVTSNPSPMEEWTPYHHIDTPHLHGYLVSNGGQFLLTPLSNGGTRVEGTTWYRHTLWPREYWRLWSDSIIHKIHWRVLSHIRDEAEKQRNAG